LQSDLHGIPQLIFLGSTTIFQMLLSQLLGGVGVEIPCKRQARFCSLRALSSLLRIWFSSYIAPGGQRFHRSSNAATDAVWQTMGLPGCNSVKLYKTIWLTRHVQGENQLIPPKPRWLGRASRSKWKHFPHWSQQQCACVQTGRWI